MNDFEPAELWILELNNILIETMKKSKHLKSYNLFGPPNTVRIEVTLKYSEHTGSIGGAYIPSGLDFKIARHDKLDTIIIFRTLSTNGKTIARVDLSHPDSMSKAIDIVKEIIRYAEMVDNSVQEAFDLIKVNSNIGKFLGTAEINED